MRKTRITEHRAWLPLKCLWATWLVSWLHRHSPCRRDWLPCQHPNLALDWLVRVCSLWLHWPHRLFTQAPLSSSTWMYSLPVPSEQQRIPELLLWEQNYRWPLKPSFLELSWVSEPNSDSQKLSALQQCWIFMKLSDLYWFGLSMVFLFGMGFLFVWLAFIVCLISFRLFLLRNREIRTSALQACTSWHLETPNKCFDNLWSFVISKWQLSTSI